MNIYSNFNQIFKIKKSTHSESVGLEDLDLIISLLNIKSTKTH